MCGAQFMHTIMLYDLHTHIFWPQRLSLALYMFYYTFIKGNELQCGHIVCLCVPVEKAPFSRKFNQSPGLISIFTIAHNLHS